MSSFLQNTLILLGLVAVAGVGYFAYTQGGFGLVTTPTDTLSLQNQRNAQDFLRKLNELEQIDVTAELFVRERFRTLIDFSVPYPTLPTGRDNPFAETP